MSGSEDHHDARWEDEHKMRLMYTFTLTDELGFSACGKSNILSRFGTGTICKNFQPFSVQSYLDGSTLMGLTYHQQPTPDTIVSTPYLETQLGHTLEGSSCGILESRDLSLEGLTTCMIIKYVVR